MRRFTFPGYDPSDIVLAKQFATLRPERECPGDSLIVRYVDSSDSPHSTVRRKFLHGRAVEGFGHLVRSHGKTIFRRHNHVRLRNCGYAAITVIVCERADCPFLRRPGDGRCEFFLPIRCSFLRRFRPLA
ncbi:MAG: hypothetical protein LBS44_03810 [Deltaproteobacteria bacterium]|nr:hypothetical protein [Deltaproteobacteria bacterium]